MFSRSLEEIISWDWCAPKFWLNIAMLFVTMGFFKKVFCRLRKSYRVYRSFTGENIGILINTGRSAVELMDANMVLNHISLAKKRGLLSSIMFSGTTAFNCDYGPWMDFHMPFAEFAVHNFQQVAQS